MSNVVAFFAPGIPQPQGSARAFVAGGRTVVTSANRNLKPWRAMVTIAAQEAMQGRAVFEQAVWVSAEFVMPRPKSHPKTKWRPHTVKPDIDKLIRSCFDSLTAVVFRDDCLVIEVRRVSKRYATDGEATGAHISVGTIE